jgi:AraC family transcriptional regulator, positive regulator of tynA and feaB
MRARSNVGRNVAWCSLRPLVCQSFDSHFSGFIDHEQLSRHIAISEVSSEACVVDRTPRLAAMADSDDVHISIQFGSRGAIRQNGRAVTVAPGSVTMYETHHPYRLDYSAPGQRQIVIQANRRSLNLSDRQLADIAASTFAPANASKASFMTYARSLLLAPRSGDAVDVNGRSEVLSELASVMMRSVWGQRDVVPTGPAALLITLETYIRENITSPDLSPESVAARYFISRRKLYDLFDRARTTPADFIRRERVERAAGLLQTRSETTSISDIAFGTGFTDTTTFSRVFRRYFGCTPHEWSADHNA